MDRPFDHSRPPADTATRPEDIDPWSEFLSESDDEAALSAASEAGDSGEGIEPVRLTVVELNPPAASADPLPPLFRPAEDIAPLEHDSRRDVDDLETQRDAREDLDEIEEPSTPPAADRSLPGPAHVSRFVRRGESFGSPLVATRAYEPNEETSFASALERDEPAPLPVPPASESPRESGRSSQPLFSARRRVAAPAPVPGRSISVHDVLHRQTAVQWSEAVAVVQAVCVAVDAADEPPCIPELEDVFITDEGEVAMSPDAHGDSDIASLGRLLHALLVNATTPLPLRLFVTSASSSDRYRSVALFADALGYYAAPGRPELIRNLYQRAMETEPVAAPPEPVPDPVASLQPVLKQGVSWSAPVAPRRRKVPTWAVAAGVGVVLGGVISAVLLRSGIGMPRTEAAVEASGAAAATAGAGGAAAAPAGDTWQLGRIVVQGRDVALDDRNIQPAASQAAPGRTPAPAPAPAPPPIPVPASGPAIGTAPPAGPAPTPSAVGTVPATTTLAPPPADHPATASTSATTTTTPVPARSQQLNTPSVSPRIAASAPAFQDPTIYTAADRDVEAAVLLTTESVPLAPLGVNDTQLETIIDLVVDPQGRVQKATLRNRPQRLPDMGVLQQVKLLRFQPAQKNGRPVSYHYTLRLLTTPR